MEKKHSQAGFTLIELAVVLIIIGLLIGGILKGRELIESARLKRVISQLNEFYIATHSFVDKYESLPGDFKYASKLIHPDLKDGNGDGIIEGKGLEEGKETLFFWSHLAASGYISHPGLLKEQHIGHFGKGAPTSKLGGGFTLETNPKNLAGIWFILGQKNGNHGDGGLLTPIQALSIDKKLDNGIPTSGRVRTFDGSDTSSHSCINSSGEYNVQNNQPVCTMYFQF